MDHIPVPDAAKSKYPDDETRIFQAPPGAVDGDIEPASVLVGHEELESGEKYRVMRLYWLPSLDDIAALRVGGYIEVSLFAASLPPMRVEAIETDVV